MHHVVQVVAPAAGQAVKAGAQVPVSFRLTDAAGTPVSDSVARALVSGSCRISVGMTGAQTVAPTCPRYLNVDRGFSATLPTARKGTGAATVRISVENPGLPPQVVDVAITLR